MRDLRIHCKNFLSHQDNEIKFDGFDSVIVLGPNGTGKSSFLVDAPLIALFGKGRSGDLDGYIRNGASDMSVEYDFALNGRRYGVIRKRSKKTTRGSSSLEFNEINEKGETIQQLTAGTIAETQEIIERTLGTDFDTLTKTSILEQGEADFFCAATPSERMELFAKIWDLDRYEVMAQISRDIWNNLKFQIMTIETRIMGAKQYISEINTQKENLILVKNDLEKEILNLVSLERKRDDFQKKIGAFENLANDLEKAKRNRIQAGQEIEKLSKHHGELLTKIERFSKILKNQDIVRAKVTEEKENEICFNMAERNLKAINESLDVLRDEINQIRKKTQTQIDMVEDKKTKIEGEIKTLGQQEIALNHGLSDIGRKEEQLKHLCIDAGKLKEISCHPDFDHTYINETCRFIKDAVEAKRLIPSMESEIFQKKNEIESNITALTNQLREFEKKRNICIQAIMEIKEVSSKSILAKEKAIKDMTSERNRKTSEIDQLKTDLAEIKRYTKLLPEIDLAEKELPELKIQSIDIEKQSSEQAKEKVRFEQEIGKIEEKIGKRKGLESELQLICRQITETSVRKDDLTKRLGFIEAEISQGEQLKVQITRDEKEIETLDGERALYQILEDAFKQIPYMLISRGIGAVENLANQILGMISQSGLSIKIETERMTKTTKKARDEIHLQITDEAGPKEYRFLSGGEKVRVAIALRLAISEILAGRRGTKIDSLIADEPFNELDEEGIEDLKEAFRKLRERFKFMAVISHITESKDTFGTQLIFSKDSEGSKMEIRQEYE